MRTEERLEDAKKLQKFLHDLTPQEWTEGLVRERDERHATEMAAWHSACDTISRSILVCFYVGSQKCFLQEYCPPLRIM